MPLRDEHWITRQGKTYVLLSGLLELAHERGLSSTSTELLDYGLDDSGGFTYAICRTTVELTDSEGTISSYTGLGDANRENVGKNIAIHLVRMSETRSLARALRVAVNIGTTALEELGGEDSQPQQQQAQNTTQNTSEMPDRTDGGATRKQLNYMLSMLPEHRKTQLEEEHGSVETWSKDAVRAMIDKLKSKTEQGGASG